MKIVRSVNRIRTHDSLRKPVHRGWNVRGESPGKISEYRPVRKVLMPGVGAATDSRQLLDSRVHSSLLVAYSRVRHTQVGRTLEYATSG